MSTVSTKNNRKANTTKRALWVLPFLAGGSLWAAVETYQYFTSAPPAPVAQEIVVAEGEPIDLNNISVGDMSVDELDAEIERVDVESQLDSPSTLPESSPVSAPAIGEDFMTVDEILSEDVDALDKAAPKVEKGTVEAEEFVNLDEILYGTTDQEKIRAIKAEEQGVDAPSRQSLEAEMRSLKKEVLEINRDLFVLEEDLLFPSSTQVNVFVSFDAKDYFALDGVSLKINDKSISNHLYTEREINALQRGAVQRLYTGNLTSGDHELIAIVTGKGPAGRDFRRAVSLDFAKTNGTKYIELKIIGDNLRKQALFQLKEWDQ